MQNLAGKASEGFLLLDSSLHPIFVNRVAAEILSYPAKPETHKSLDTFLSGKIKATLVAREGSADSALVSEFQSGRRRYQCRAYRVDGPGSGKPRGSVAVLLERFAAPGSFSLGLASERFRLTSREQEVLQHLLVGRTTKEIATGMEISPHTVKAFLRMIMVKMGVSTRSGIVGKAFSSRDWPAPERTASSAAIGRLVH
jgi:DNA-binding CsgD family transcriptional regulator